MDHSRSFVLRVNRSLDAERKGVLSMFVGIDPPAGPVNVNPVAVLIISVAWDVYYTTKAKGDQHPKVLKRWSVPLCSV